jgi:hypothetical protein
MSSLEKYEPPVIADVDQWAKKLYESGSFPDAKSVAQAFVKIAAGAELGLSPFQSMSGVHLIQGKPVVGAGLLAALLDRDPDYDYSTAWEPDEINPTACIITVTKNGKQRGTSRFSMDDAKRAGLSGGNWQKYPKAMLFARAMSQAVRWYAPGATGTSVYVEGELTADVEVTVPEGVTAKPRTRVTAEVIPDPQRDDGEEHVEDADVVLVVPAGQLRPALAALDANQRRVLYTECGITKGMKLAEVTDRLWIKWAELGLPDDVEGEPVPITILGAMYERAAKRGSADAFQHMLDTDEDLDPGDQASIEAIA